MDDFNPTEQPFLAPASTKATVHANGFVLEVDLPQMLTAMDPQAIYRGNDGEDDYFERGSLASQIVSAAASLLVTQMKDALAKEITKTVSAEVETQVAEIVKSTLEKPIQKTTDWGSPVGEAKPLRDMINATANDMLTKPTGDSYSRGGKQTPVQRIITEAVSAQFAKDLKAVTEKARQQALAAVETQAASVLKETIIRASRGL